MDHQDASTFHGQWLFLHTLWLAFEPSIRLKSPLQSSPRTELGVCGTWMALAQQQLRLCLSSPNPMVCHFFPIKNCHNLGIPCYPLFSNKLMFKQTITNPYARVYRGRDYILQLAHMSRDSHFITSIILITWLFLPTCVSRTLGNHSRQAWTEPLNQAKLWGSNSLPCFICSWPRQPTSTHFRPPVPRWSNNHWIARGYFFGPNPGLPKMSASQALAQCLGHPQCVKFWIASVCACRTCHCMARSSQRISATSQKWDSMFNFREPKWQNVFRVCLENWIFSIFGCLT